jgi:hypothetical protein
MLRPRGIMMRMRTTLTLEPDVSDRIREYARRSGISFKEAVNTMLRRGLAAAERTPPKRRRFKVIPHSGGFQPGVDPYRLNQLLDEMEVEEFLRKSGKTK